MQQKHHHVHYSYEKDLVCDDNQMHQQQQSQSQQQQTLKQQHDEQQPPHQQQQQQQMHCPQHAYSAIDYSQTQIQSATPHHRHQQQQQQQQQPRKHSHSSSRHTSPHSHSHSHSLHSSPHQSHTHMHESGTRESNSLPRTAPRPATQSQFTPTPHSHHHHHQHRRRKRQNGHSHKSNGNGSGNSSVHGPHQRSHGATCNRRHRSVTDISSTSINTCQDASCVDREVQEILVRKSCCSNSRTELAQYFAEDLYGTSRRPSSCCTSSDYCYQTDSTSLYGSRSSLSRNNSIKSASVALRKKRTHQRQPSYTSISMHALNATHPGATHLGSHPALFDRSKPLGVSGKSRSMVVSPSKAMIKRQSSKDRLSQELPDYACSPSPIRWSFLQDSSKSLTDLEAPPPTEQHKVAFARTEGRTRKRCPRERIVRRSVDGDMPKKVAAEGWKISFDDDDRPSTSAAARKRRQSPFRSDFEQSTTVVFHQEGEQYNNCCSNYIQCNTYLDQDLQITSEDIHQYLSKGRIQLGDVLNNSKNYPFQPSNALEFQYKNNFVNTNTTNNNNTTLSSEGGESARLYNARYQRNSSKETNLNQNIDCAGGRDCNASGCNNSTQPLSPTNINLSSSSNNINIVFGASNMERNANEVKFINTARSNVVSSEAHHTGYLPYTYPSHDYTNMSANSTFDKKLGIDELPKEFGAGAACSPSVTTSEDQHSSPLPSPVQTGVSFESFDAPSDHHLLSQRGSCQFTPTPRSPLSPASPVSSCHSSAIAYMQAQYECQYPQGGDEDSYQQQQQPQYFHQHQQQQQQRRRSSTSSHNHRHHHHYLHQHEHQHHDHADGFRISNAFRKVRKRARKYTDFLRKK